MTPRQRWLAMFERRPVDRLPTDYWATGEFHAKLKLALGKEDDEAVWRHLSIDRPRMVGPVYRPKTPRPAGQDMWGMKHESINYGTGTYNEVTDPPLANVDSVQQMLDYPWPTPDDMDHSGIAPFLASDDGSRIIQGGHYEPFLHYCSMRGMEQAYMDVLTEPELAHAALSKMYDFWSETNRRTWQAGAGRIDMMYLAEDLGAQTGPLFSLDCYREFILPNQQKMAALAKSFGVRVFYHTDGSARQFLPDLIDVVGIDLLNPLQWCCPGMELEGLVQDFGNKIVFHGGIDNQRTLPFGTPDEVRQQVRDVARIMRNQRWICAPCHNIQNVSPVENVIAMYEEAGRIAPEE